MGGFTPKFVQSAAMVARRLKGTLYARYYALPVAEVLAIEAALPRATESVTDRMLAKAAKLLGKPRPVDAFGALCERMANIEPNIGWSVVRNGRVIEQQQILTTQNLVPLIDAAGISEDRFPELAWRSFEWLIERVQARASRHDQRRAARNAAFSWRQMIVFLSLCSPDITDALLVRAREHLNAQPSAFQTRFAPILAGLESAHAGCAPAVRLLGWTSGEHPLEMGTFEQA